jgi:hypothetical protein
MLYSRASLPRRIYCSCYQPSCPDRFLLETPLYYGIMPPPVATVGYMRVDLEIERWRGSSQPGRNARLRQFLDQLLGRWAASPEKYDGISRCLIVKLLFELGFN